MQICRNLLSFFAPADVQNLPVCLTGRARRLTESEAKTLRDAREASALPFGLFHLSGTGTSAGLFARYFKEDKFLYDPDGKVVYQLESTFRTEHDANPGFVDSARYL